MEEDNAGRAGAGAIVVGTKSWVAYVGTLLLAVVLFGGLLPLAFLWDEIAAAVVLAVSALVVGYRFLSLRSVQLYYDDIGVWVYSGILPWKKGVAGVKWRDMDEAIFEPGFWSWVSGSYSVRIGHRFTKASEIYLTHIGDGREVAARLNVKQQELMRAGVID
ncbi:MAG: hypothetical protein V4857_20915 [Pseudomonadota bacterium]